MVKMHADELDVDAPLVRRRLATQFPHWYHLPLAPVPSSGTDHALFRLGEEMVVWLPRIKAMTPNTRLLKSIARTRFVPSGFPHAHRPLSSSPIVIGPAVLVDFPLARLPNR